MKEYRDEASRVLAALKLDTSLSVIRVPELYREVISLIDAHDEYLTELSQLSRSLEQREQTDSEAAVEKGVLDAITKAGSKDAEEGSPSFAGGLKRGFASGAAGVQSFAAEEKRLKEIREQDKQGRLALLERNVERVDSDFTANTKALAALFSRELKIAQIQLGLDSVLADIQIFKRQNDAAITQLRQQMMRDRPNDPLVHALALMDAAPAKKESLEACLQLAEKCSGFADTIPLRSELNYSRYSILTFAANIVETFFDTAHPFSGAWGSIRNEKALVASSYREKAQESFADPTGSNMALTAWDYFLSGRFEDSLAAAEQAEKAPGFKRSAGFCLKVAQLNSLLGKTDESLRCLTELIDSFKYTGVKELYADDDLAELRKHRRKAFDALLALDHEWWIDFGWVNDAIVFTNKSRYPLTNVRLRPHIESGTQEWDLNLHADAVNAGETVRWKKALSVRGSRTSVATATLTCDQSR